MTPEVYFVLVSLASAFLHGTFGFGFPLLATPLLILVFDMQTAILLTLVPTVSVNLVSILAERDWRAGLRAYWPIPTFTIVGGFLGTQLLLSVDPEPFRLLLAIAMIAYLIGQHRYRVDRRYQVPGWGMAVFGLLLGLMAGVVNIFSPLVIVYALFTQIPTALMVAIFNLSFLTSKSGQILGFISRGAFDLSVVKVAVLALPLILAALWVGIRVRRGVDTEQYRDMLRAALWIISIAIIIDLIWHGLD